MSNATPGTYDPARNETTPRDVLVGPLAAAGIAAIVTAVTAYARRSSRRLNTADRQRADLVGYLRDHLSGSDAALQVVRRLAASGTGGRDGSLFWQLADEFEQERATLRTVLARLGASPGSPKRAASYVSGAVLSSMAGGKAGELSLLRSLEGLAVGIQGKRCLWRSLQALGGAVATHQAEFAELESRAVRQWEFVEGQRRAAAIAVFGRPE